MRSSAVVALALAAAAAPALSAPTNARISFSKRDGRASALLARQQAQAQQPSTSGDDQSGASFISDFGHGFVQGFEGTAKALLPIATAFLKRDDAAELLARAAQGAATQGDDQSGASFISDFGHGFVQGFEGTAKALLPIATAFLKRDDAAELLARAAAAEATVGQPQATQGNDESGASFISDFGHGFVQGFTGTLKTLLPIATAFIKRDDAPELLARAAAQVAQQGDDQSGASFISDFGHGFVQGFEGTAKALLPIATAFLKRDEAAELLARADAAQTSVGQPQATQGDDESGASFISDFGHGFVQGFTGTLKTLLPIATAFIKRDDVSELLARAAAEVAQQGDDQSGASFISDFGHGFVQGFEGTAKALLPIATAFLKRDDVAELLARAAEAAAAQGDDQSGASFISDFGHGFVQGFEGTAKALLPIATAFLKREEVARSLNELD